MQIKYRKVETIVLTGSIRFVYACAFGGFLGFASVNNNKMAAGGEHGAMRQWVPLQRQLVPAALEKEEEAYSRNVRRRQREAMQDALRKGFMKTLDQDLILQQWRDDSEGEESSGSLEHVLRVSLPRSGVQAVQDVALLSCPRLRICNLPHCFIRDLSAFYGCVNLLKLDLSNNQVSLNIQYPSDIF